MSDTRRPAIYWCLAGPREQASSRLHGYLIHEYLCKKGWDSTILYNAFLTLDDLPLEGGYFWRSSVFRPGDIVIFQKLSGPMTCEALYALKARGIHTVFIDCDLPLKIEEGRLASLVVCPSTVLVSKYIDVGVRIVTQVQEAFESTVLYPRNDIAQYPMTYVWFGNVNPAKVNELKWLKALFRDNFPDHRLIIVSDYPRADYQWRLGESWSVIANADVAVISGNESDEAQAKSSNRAVQAMALGLPVLAYPLPAYKQVIRHGRNGLLCQTDSEWISAIKRMNICDTRKRIAAAGFRYARRYFSMESVGASWESALTSLISSQVPQSTSSTVDRNPIIDHIRVSALENMKELIESRNSPKVAP